MFKSHGKLDRKTLEKYQTQLLDEKRRIVEELIASSQEYDSLAPDMEVGDLVDQAFRTYEVNLLFDIGASEKRRLHEIDSALDRVRNGSYGMCSACRKPIAAKRLNAMPWAELCVKCKEEEEKKPVAPSEGPEE